jgi:trigger factor
MLVGKKVGETVEFDEPFAADHRNAALRGRDAHMKVTLRGLQTRLLPPIDDALAQKVGVESIDTLAGLTARIRADLEKRETRKSESEFKDALIKAALEKNEFEVPPSLVEQAIDQMLEGTAERFARMGVDIAQLQLDVARLRGDLREQAIQQVKGALFLDALAEMEKITVTDDDRAAEVARMADEMGIPLGTVQKQMRGKEARVALDRRVREEKAVSLLAQAASIKA